jgi:pimeloyl-ACP methyl ester carboxylesterase
MLFAAQARSIAPQFAATAARAAKAAGAGAVRVRDRVKRISMRDRVSGRVAAAFASLPERYLGAATGFDATYEIRLGDIGRLWEVRVDGKRCTVRTSASADPDVVIGTDARTWLALREGWLSGLDAFAARRLYVRGNLDLALGFEGLFALPGGRPPLVRIEQVATEAGRLSALVSGTGAEHVVCLHGLGSSKAAFFETISALAPELTVHAIDLPGFGSSAKPARACYDPPFFARAVRSYLDASGIDRAHVVGNSMGGRVAIELGLHEPDRVASLSLLCPSLAFRRRRGLVPLVKLLRPELAAFPHPMRSTIVRDQLSGLFARPDRLDPAIADVVADEFCRGYRTRAVRVAFFAAARSIYLDAPWGESGFWTRLPDLAPPALFVWGEADRLVPVAFSGHVARALPAARQVVLADCGHVPQIELAAETNRLVRAHIETSRGAVEQVAESSKRITWRARRLARAA